MSTWLSKEEEAIVICESLGISRSDLILNPDLLNHVNAVEYFKRLENNEPLAHISGTQPFMGFDFEVNKHVLIPRPETELLVETIIKDIATKQRNNIAILDLGTGSGAIAITISKILPNAKVTATDISKEALEIAKKNNKHLSASVSFVQGNLFEPIKNCKFDIIVSNPPYIPTGEINKLDPTVKDFEPKMALDGGADGLEIIRKIVGSAKSYLNQGGCLALEIGFGQAAEVSKFFKYAGFQDISIIKDYAGIDRIIHGKTEI